MAYSSSNYRRRLCVSAVTTGAAGTADIEWAVPSQLTEFWDAIDVNGYGIRVTAADGKTPIPYAWNGFNYSNKTGTIRIDGAQTPAFSDRCVLIWIYYDVTSPADGSSAVTITSPLSAYIDIARPDPAHLYAVVPQADGATTPRYRTGKGVNESIFVWFDVTTALQALATPYNGRMSWEEAGVGQVEVLDSDGNAVPSMTVAADMRWISERGGATDRMYLRCRVTGGTDGAEYTLRATIITSAPGATSYRTITASVAISVRDTLAGGAVSVAPLGTTGWARYTDGAYTSGSPLALPASTRTQLKDDGATAVETYSPGGAVLWSSDAIHPGQQGEVYALRVTYTIAPSAGNGVMVIDLDIGAAPFSGASNIVQTETFPIGPGTASRTKSMVLLLEVADTDAVTNGVAIGMSCSVNANVYDISVTVARTH